MDTKATNAHSRRLGDFLARPAAERAGVIEARLGASAPLQYDASFEWPSSPEISALEYDSRKIGEGSLFFALPGLHADGHKFVNSAVELGARAVVHQDGLAEYREGILYIRVRDSRFAMSPIADAFYGSPSRRMGIIGVTGTEGKSTTVYLIYQLLALLGKKTGFVSTVMQGDGLAEKWTSEHQTTPEAVAVHRLLAEMSRNGAEYAVLESSSHGLSKRNNRLGDVDFDVGVLTNVTHEHLEFHGTFEQYRSDKAELFRALDLSPHKKDGGAGEFCVPSFGVANADDPSAGYFAAATKRKTYTFSTKGAKADLSVCRVESEAGGNSYEALVAPNGKALKLRDSLPGAFNAGNVLAALLVVSNLLSMEVEGLAPLVPLLKPVRGRMTAVDRGQPFEVIVDYAHTPSSFEAVLPPLRERLDSSGGRLICLFGSAGERDTQKRKAQGEIAARYSDIVILADEDPRGEEPMAILEEIANGCFAAKGCETSHGCEAAKGCETSHGCEAAKGCETSHGCKTMTRGESLFLIPNRPEAIRKAISLARKGDLVLLLGKGHENSIIYARQTMAYDEIGEAEAALDEAKK